MITVGSSGIDLGWIKMNNSQKILYKDAGFLATFVGIISTIPIILTVSRTKVTKNFPWQALFLALLSNLLWMTFGYFNKVNSSLLQGALYFIFYAFVAITKFGNPRLG